MSRDRTAVGEDPNEELVGRALKGRRDGVVLATKFGRVSHAGDGPGNLDSRWPTSAPQWRGPLRRLGTDGIDLYYSTGSTRTHH